MPQTIDSQLRRNNGLYHTYSVIKSNLLTDVQTRWCSSWPEGNDHGPKHIERVLENLAAILGMKTPRSPRPLIDDYELFLSMLAVVAHDIGMLRGRQGHAESSAKMLSEIAEQNNLLLDEHALPILAAAIECHSSSVDLALRCQRFDEVETVAGHTVRPRLVAALVRLADELDEDHRRARKWLQRITELPESSLPYWEFCQRIQGIDIGKPGGEITFNVVFEKNDVARIVRDQDQTMSFAWFFARKVAKLNRERSLTSRYLGDFARSGISLVVRPIEGFPGWESSRRFDLTDPPESETDSIRRFLRAFPELLTKEVSQWAREVPEAIGRREFDLARKRLKNLKDLFDELPPDLRLDVIYGEALLHATLASGLGGQSEEYFASLAQASEAICRWINEGLSACRADAVRFGSLEIQRFSNDPAMKAVVAKYGSKISEILPPGLKPALDLTRAESLPPNRAPAAPGSQPTGEVHSSFLPQADEPEALVHKAIRDRCWPALYAWHNLHAEAVRLVGAQDETFPPERICITIDHSPYIIPPALADGRHWILGSLKEEWDRKGIQLFDGPCVRLVDHYTSPRDATEDKHLHLTLGKMTWYDYVLTNQRFGDPGISHQFPRRGDVRDYINISSLADDRSLKGCQLSNILTAYVTLITADGYLVYSQRTGRVATHRNMLISAVSENLHPEKDGVFGEMPNKSLFLAATRGISEELSPKLSPKHPTSEILLLGLEFHFQGYHPGLLFLACLHCSRDEFLVACQETPGKDYLEGSSRFVHLEDTPALEAVLNDKNWFPAGKASIIRSLEFLSDLAQQRSQSLVLVANSLAP